MGEKLWVGLSAAGFFLGAGLAVAAFLLGGAARDVGEKERLVTVKGLSERTVEADYASWRLPFRGVGPDRDAAIADAIRARDLALRFGRSAGLADEAMAVEPFSITVDRTFVSIGGGRQEERLRYSAIGAVRMRSGDVGLIEELSGRSSELLDEGVLLGDNDYASTPRAVFAFTKFNDLKPEMIAEATLNARAAASRFAEDSGSSVGRIASANQGVVQILAAEGEYDERHERRKLIRVVSTVRYELVD